MIVEEFAIPMESIIGRVNGKMIIIIITAPNPVHPCRKPDRNDPNKTVRYLIVLSSFVYCSVQRFVQDND